MSFEVSLFWIAVAVGSWFIFPSGVAFAITAYIWMIWP